MPSLDYEYLIWTGSRGLSRKITWDIKQMAYSSGYYAAVRTGPAEGTVEWALNFRAHRDRIRTNWKEHGVSRPFQPRLVSTTIILPNGTADSSPYHPISEYVYIRDFVIRRMTNNNQPFYFEDIDAYIANPGDSGGYGARKKYLCRLLSDSIEFAQDNNDPLVYTCNLAFIQVRGWTLP